VVYQNQEAFDHFARSPRCSVFQTPRGFEKVRSPLSLHSPLTTAHSKVGTLAFASKAPDVYNGEEVQFLKVVADQIALAFDNALLFDAAQASQQQLLKKSERVGLLLELTNHVVSNLEFRDLLEPCGEHAPGYGLRWRWHYLPDTTRHLADLRPWISPSATIPPRGRALSPLTMISRERSFAPVNSGVEVSWRRGGSE